MSELEQVLEKLNAAQDEEQRSQCCVLLRELTTNQKAAHTLWSEAQSHACAEAEPFTFVLWFGAERARALHRLHLEQRRLGRELTDLTGVGFSDSMGIVEEIDVIEAYAQSEAQSASERADSVLEILTQRRKRLEQVTAALDAI